MNCLQGYKSPEVAEWNKYKDDLKRQRKRKLQGTYTDLTLTAPAFVDGLDVVGAATSTVDKTKLSLELRSTTFVDKSVVEDDEIPKLEPISNESGGVTTKLHDQVWQSNSSFSSLTSTTAGGTRPPPPRLGPPVNPARRRRTTAEGDEVSKDLEIFIDVIFYLFK